MTSRPPQPGDRVELGDHRHAVQRQAAQRLRRPPGPGQCQGIERLGRRLADSDVRLASPDPDLSKPSDSDVTLIKDDTADHHFLTPSSGSDETAIRSSPMAGSLSSDELQVPESDSDFELNPSSDLVDMLQPESGSDFELGTRTPATSLNRSHCAPAIRT